jgi:hypothetical protein
VCTSGTDILITFECRSGANVQTLYHHFHSFSISLQAGLLCRKSFSLVAKALVPSLLEVNLQIVLGFAEAGHTHNRSEQHLVMIFSLSGHLAKIIRETPMMLANYI